MYLARAPVGIAPRCDRCDDIFEGERWGENVLVCFEVTRFTGRTSHNERSTGNFIIHKSVALRQMPKIFTTSLCSVLRNEIETESD